ncbi:hypothetical protein OA46_20645 [Enterobacter cloacae]|nr:hypothetical protein OA46_20645 [Enterobacter cloacae]
MFLRLRRLHHRPDVRYKKHSRGWGLRANCHRRYPAWRGVAWRGVAWRNCNPISNFPENTTKTTITRTRTRTKGRKLAPFGS